MKKNYLLFAVSVLLLTSCVHTRPATGETQVKANHAAITTQDSSEQTKTDSTASSVSVPVANFADSAVVKNRNSVEIILGYLKVFPEELGVFMSEPTSVISQINSQVQYGYNNWRIPTKEELTLLRNNGYIRNGEYMTQENKKGIVLLVSDGQDYAILQAQEKQERSNIKQVGDVSNNKKGWVDLGLRSGTLWKAENEDGLFTYEQAMDKFGNSLPTREQLAELATECTWKWDNNGYRVTGPNGNFITMPAEGYSYCNGDKYGVGSDGEYWSSTPEVSVNAMRLFFNRYGIGLSYNYQCRGRSVRLVENKK